jgi:(p)ppGpp synthase/HD superfamily hydrolase
MKPTQKTTLSLIKKAHAGQMYGTDPYWTHPLAVAEKGKELFGSKFTESAYLAALLHDVVEDTDLSLFDLQKLGYSSQVLDTVKLLTKDKSLDYEGNIRRIIQSRNKLAMMVKFADNFINYTGDKSHWDAKRAAKSQAKYLKSMQDIGKVLGIDPMIHFFG